MLRKITILILLAMGLTGQARAETTITFATSGDFPPMEYVDEEGNIVGFAVEYVHAAGRLAGFKPVFKKVAWTELASGLTEGLFDAMCSSTSITEERKKEFDFSRPYYKIQQVQVVEKGGKFSTTESLEGIRVGAQVGSTGFELGEQTAGIVLKPYTDIKSAMDDLLAKRLEAVICDDPVASYYINIKFKGLLQRARFIRHPETESYGIAVKKGNADTLDLINKGIAAVQARGIDRELQLKWMGL